MAEDNLVELEIAAFMGPHIKRARIVLAFAGALYCIAGWFDYARVAELRAMVARAAADAPHAPELARAQHIVDLAYVLVVGGIIAGVANIALAAIAGTKTMIAFYAAAAIFAAYSLLQLYVSHGLLLTNWLWWLTAIVVGMGFEAARKAEKLRRGESR